MIYLRLICLSILCTYSVAKESCQEKITAKFPNAKCVDVDDIDDCKSECEHIGEKQCKGRKGEITKLNCKDESANANGRFPCCCE